MSVVIDVLVIVAILGFVVYQQARPRRVASMARRWWLLPAVLVIAAFREPDLIDTSHPTASVLLLVAGALAGAATGVAWVWTARVWMDESGAVWSRARVATLWAWLGGLALGAAVRGVGVLLHVQYHSSLTMVTLAASLLLRTGMLVRRGRALESGAPAGPGAFRPGDGPQAAGRERTRG